MLNIMRKLGTALKLKVGQKSGILDEVNSEDEEENDKQPIKLSMAKAKSSPMVNVFKPKKFASPKDQVEPH